MASNPELFSISAFRKPVSVLRWRTYLFHSCIAFLAYAVAGKLAQETTSLRSNNLGPVWPAFGVALGAVLLYGYRIWPAILSGAFLVALFSPVEPITALGQAIAAVLAALTGAFLLKRYFGFDCRLPRLKDAVCLITVGALGSALISSSLGTLALHAAQVRPYTGMASGWLVYWLGDSTGVLLVTPFMLTLPSLLQLRKSDRWLEFLLSVLLLVAVTFIVFGRNLFGARGDFLAFAVSPFVMWAAIRMGTPATSLCVLLVAGVATVETELGSGPFAGSSPFINAVLLDIYFTIVSLTGLMLAGAIGERENAERRREQLVRKQSRTEARLRLASIVESSNDAFIGALRDGTITDWNRGAQDLFGYSAWEMSGKPVAVLMIEATEELNAVLNDFTTSMNRNRYEAVCQTKSGTRFDAAIGVSPIFDAAGKICGGSVSIRDITILKREEALLRESEARFRLVADNAPVLIWMSGPDKLCTYFNKRWLEFTGRPAEMEMGNGWAEGVHLDDLKTCLDTYITAFDKREDFKMEYRLRRHDGEYRWILDIGTPRFKIDGSFAGYIGSALDVTEAKLAHEAMASVSRRLVEAQENERARVARELHDDINQRLALLSIELEKYEANGQNPQRDLKSNIAQKLREILDDIHAISRDLHPSKLEHLGLVPAVRSFCAEFSQQHKVEIAFRYDNTPLDVSPEAALALFRIVQEALHNAQKHSQVRHFTVEVGSGTDHVYIKVSDLGVGFDPAWRSGQEGLGLVSIRERARLVNGTAQIDSKPMHGTTVCVRVPTASQSTKAPEPLGVDCDDLSEEAS